MIELILLLKKPPPQIRCRGGSHHAFDGYLKTITIYPHVAGEVKNQCGYHIPQMSQTQK